MKEVIKLSEKKNKKNIFEPLILTLFINESDCELTKEFTYNPNIYEPEPHNNLQEYELIQITNEEINNENNFEDYQKEEEKKVETYFINESGQNKKYYIHENNNLIDKHNLYCWWCCHIFNNNAFYLPVKYENNIFQVKGYFCSFSCVMTYNKNIKDSKVNERNSLIYLMKKKMYKKEINNITYSLPRETLKIFGGNLSIEEFRKKSNDTDININIYYPPMIPIVPKIEESQEIHHKKWEHNTTYFMNQASDILKIKRDKPLNNRKYTLEKYMNIKKTNI
jgi:hypothetical protein